MGPTCRAFKSAALRTCCRTALRRQVLGEHFRAMRPRPPDRDLGRQVARATRPDQLAIPRDAGPEHQPFAREIGIRFATVRDDDAAALDGNRLDVVAGARAYSGGLRVLRPFALLGVVL